MGPILLRLLPAFLVVSALGCGPGVAADGETKAPELASRIARGEAPVVLDVRSAEEYASGHVPGARNVPVDELAARLAELGSAREAEVVVYCERGGRAERARKLLREAGFSDVRHLEGDMSGWRSDRLPCEGC